LKNYYFILGLNIYASQTEIKHAYRKLALQFHPDKNATSEAEAIFKEVNEAYEVLGDSQKKFAYDQLLRGVSPAAATSTRAHRDPGYRPRPPGSFSRKSNRQEMLETMSDYLKYALMVSRLTLLFAAILIADFTLPREKTEREIIHTSYKREFRSGSAMQLDLEEGASISLKKGDANEFRQGERILVYRSSIFDVPVEIENERTHFKAKIPIGIYGNFIFCPLIMIITSILGTFYWKGIEFRFNLGVVNCILCLLSILFLRIHVF